MTAPIGALSAVNGLSGISGLSGVAATNGTDAAAGVNTDFAGMLSKGLQNVQAAQAKSDDLAVQVANGTLADPAPYTMASTQDALGMQLTMAIRNNAVEAFEEIMRMQE